MVILDILSPIQMFLGLNTWAKSFSASRLFADELLTLFLKNGATYTATMFSNCIQWLQRLYHCRKIHIRVTVTIWGTMNKWLRWCTSKTYK